MNFNNIYGYPWILISDISYKNILSIYDIDDIIMRFFIVVICTALVTIIGSLYIVFYISLRELLNNFLKYRYIDLILIVLSLFMFLINISNIGFLYMIYLYTYIVFLGIILYNYLNKKYNFYYTNKLKVLYILYLLFIYLMFVLSYVKQSEFIGEVLVFLFLNLMPISMYYTIILSYINDLKNLNTEKKIHKMIKLHIFNYVCILLLSFIFIPLIFICVYAIYDILHIDFYIRDTSLDL
jgi:hypothetical protein